MIELKPWVEYEDIRKVVRVTFGLLPYFQISTMEAFDFSISKLLFLYQQTGKEPFLENALIDIYSFLEMGYPYDKKKVLFDEILQEAGMAREQIIPKHIQGAISCAEVKRTDVDKIIKSWPRSKNRQYSRDELVETIFQKIKNREEGVYSFFDNEDSASYSKREVLQLIITKNECYVHDEKRDLYHQFSL